MDNGIKKQQQLHHEALLYMYATPAHQRTADEIAKHLLLSPEEVQEVLTKLMDDDLIDNPPVQQAASCHPLLSPAELREAIKGLTDEELVTQDDLYALTQAGIQRAESL